MCGDPRVQHRHDDALAHRALRPCGRRIDAAARIVQVGLVTGILATADFDSTFVPGIVDDDRVLQQRIAHHVLHVGIGGKACDQGIGTALVDAQHLCAVGEANDGPRLGGKRAQCDRGLRARQRVVVEFHDDAACRIEGDRGAGDAERGQRNSETKVGMHVSSPQRSMPKPTPAERSSLLNAPPRLSEMRSDTLRA